MRAWVSDRVQRFLNLPGEAALTVLIIVGAVSGLLYAWMVVPLAPLVKLYEEPLLDLLGIMKKDPLAHVRLSVAFILLGILYAVGWWFSRKVSGRAGWAAVTGSMVLCGAVLLNLYPYGAADIYDNISHGRILGIYGANPFKAVTSDFPEDPFAQYPAWSHSPSAYGPAWEYLAAGTARLAGDGIFENTLAFKLLPGLFAWLTALLVGLILRRAAPERALPAVWLVGMNPLILYETFGHGHNDMAMVFWMVAAAWAMERRRFTLAILALVMGGLVKYIPILLIPAAGAVALVELPNIRERLKFMVLTGLLAVGLAVLMYSPFWFGWETLTLERRARLFTTSLPSIFYHFLEKRYEEEKELVGQIVAQVAGLITLAFALWAADRAARQSNGRPVLERFSQAGLLVLLFYLLVTVPWFHPWYMVWPVALAALLPPGPAWIVAFFSSFAVLTKSFWFGPAVFLWHPGQESEWLELRLTAGTMTLPWLAAIAAMWHSRPRKMPRKKWVPRNLFHFQRVIKKNVR